MTAGNAVAVESAGGDRAGHAVLRGSDDQAGGSDRRLERAAAGLVGVYQINARVPGFHLKGDALPVTLRIGGVSSPTTGPTAALVYVN